MFGFLFSVGFILALKHCIFDGWLQTAYQYKNKGKWMHPGGILHAGLHSFGTFVAVSLPLFFYAPEHLELGLILAVMDFVLHYLTDYAKMNLGSKEWAGFGKDEDGRDCLRIYSDKYFWALVADQAVHFATYALIIAITGAAI